jgi:hypothetical protein
VRTDELRIGGRSYRKVEHGVFVVPYLELEDLKFTDVPYYSQVDIRPLPIEPSLFRVTAEALHAGGPDNEEFTVSVKVVFTVPGVVTDPLVIRKYKRIKGFIHQALAPAVSAQGFRFSPAGIPFFEINEGLYCIEGCHRDYTREENPTLAAVLQPILESCRALAGFRDTLAFICHASEDKPFVDSLCQVLDAQSVPVWYDRREIRVGDSIVQQISDGLGAASHLVIILSNASSTKPWVLKELSAGLMRQLGNSSIGVLPVLIESCQVPPILSDIRYADCRDNAERGMAELLAALV